MRASNKQSKHVRHVVLMSASPSVVGHLSCYSGKTWRKHKWPKHPHHTYDQKPTKHPWRLSGCLMIQAFSTCSLTCHPWRTKSCSKHLQAPSWELDYGPMDLWTYGLTVNVKVLVAIPPFYEWALAASVILNFPTSPLPTLSNCALFLISSWLSSDFK